MLSELRLENIDFFFPSGNWISSSLAILPSSDGSSLISDFPPNYIIFINIVNFLIKCIISINSSKITSKRLTSWPSVWIPTPAFNNSAVPSGSYPHPNSLGKKLYCSTIFLDVSEASHRVLLLKMCSKWREKVKESKFLDVAYTNRRLSWPPVTINNQSIAQAIGAKYLPTASYWRKNTYVNKKRTEMDLKFKNLF